MSKYYETHLVHPYRWLSKVPQGIMILGISTSQTNKTNQTSLLHRLRKPGQSELLDYQKAHL